MTLAWPWRDRGVAVAFRWRGRGVGRNGQRPTRKPWRESKPKPEASAAKAQADNATVAALAEAQSLAAVAIQAAFRGYSTRRANMSDRTDRPLW